MKLDFDKTGGLVPAIIQDAETGKVLMLAYMNSIAWEKTLETGKAWFYSRSRDKQWMKGEESGNVQIVKEVFVDCDDDTVLLKVEQVGNAACHKGYSSCFFRKVNGDVKIQRFVIVPDEFLRFVPLDLSNVLRNFFLKTNDDVFRFSAFSNERPCVSQITIETEPLRNCESGSEHLRCQNAADVKSADFPVK